MSMMMSSEQIVALGALPSRFDLVDQLLRQIIQVQAQQLQVARDTEQLVTQGQAAITTALHDIAAAIAQNQAEQTQLLQQILDALTETPQASKFVIEQQAVKKEK